MPGRWENLLERLPEAERAVADGQLRRDRQATGLEVDQQLVPALGALAHPDLEANQLLLALRGRADQHQHALGLWLHPRLQVNAIIQCAPKARTTSGGRFHPESCRLLR